MVQQISLYSRAQKTLVLAGCMFLAIAETANNLK